MDTKSVSKRNKNGKKKTKPLYRGVVVRLDDACARLYQSIGASMVGKAMTAYSREGEYLLHRRALAEQKKEGRDTRQTLAGVLEESGIARAITRLFHLLGDCPLSVYGIFFLLYGIISVLMHILEQVLNGTLGQEIGTTLTAAAIAVCAIPLLCSSDSVRICLRGSFLGRLLLGKDQPLSVSGGTRHYSTVKAVYIALFFGTGLGLLTLFFHPIAVPLAALAVGLLFLYLLSPEAGWVLTVAATPFLWIFDRDMLLLPFLILLIWISYIGKLLMGRRTIRLGLCGVLVILFGANYLLCGFGTGSDDALVCAVRGTIFISGYFLAGNLMTSDIWADRCMQFLSGSVLTLCACTLLLRRFGQMAIAWCISRGADTFLAVLEPLYHALCEEGESFCLFILPLLPLFLVYLTRSRNLRGGALRLLFLALLLLTVAQGVDGWVWLTLCIGLFLYLLLCSHHTLTVLLLSLLPAACLFLLFSLPFFSQWEPILAVRAELASLGGIGEVTVDIGAVGEILLANPLGIGVGDGVLDAAWLASGAVGSAPASVWICLPLSLGLQGGVLFLLILVLYLQRTLEYRKLSFDKKRRANAFAVCFGLILLLILGIRTSIFASDYHMYLFWALAGVTNAFIRAGLDSEYRSLADGGGSVTCADITVSMEPM